MYLGVWMGSADLITKSVLELALDQLWGHTV